MSRNGEQRVPGPTVRGLGRLLARIGGAEQTEQAAFWRTHQARETARQARVRAQRDHREKAAALARAASRAQAQPWQ